MKVKPNVYKTLVRVDKHGNKHYRTNCCKKCGGTGNVGYTLDDGRCWRCMGSGIEDEHTVVEYTLEQQQLRAEKRTARRLGTVEQQLRRMGFDAESKVAYRSTGNTFSVKDTLKVLGGVWDSRYGHWTLPVKPDCCESEKLTLDSVEIEEYGTCIKYQVVRWK